MRVTEDTPCAECGDPLGMDSGHHVQYGTIKGEPCHWECLAALYRSEAESLRSESKADATNRELAEARETIRILGEQLAEERKTIKKLRDGLCVARDALDRAEIT